MLKRISLLLALILVYSYVLAGCAFVNVSLTDKIQPLKEKKIAGSGRDKILIIDLSGLILEGSLPSILNQKQKIDPVARIKEELNKAEGDKRIKGIVIKINSPGGTVTASDIIYHEIKKFKEKREIPVVASIINLGASGAYYVATSADKIFVHPTSIIGSIGVIMVKFNIEGLMEKIGVKHDTIKSGKLKDMGSIFRGLTPEEEEIFQKIIDNLYNRFIDIVAEERSSLSREDAIRLGNGRVYTAEEGLSSGLADEIGYLDDAINKVKEMAGIEKAKIITYYRPGTYKENIYSITTPFNPQAYSLFDTILSHYVSTMGTQFMYLWIP
ncbi:MAG: signal peptide peptidase SppA [Nitrospirota bacterium]